MRWIFTVSIAILVTQQCVAPPVSQNKEEEPKKEQHEESDDINSIEYHRYLKEVVEVLESDPEFRAKLKDLSDEDVTNAKIAEELDFVNHNVRTKLDEVKRVELERLRHLASQAFEAENSLDTDHLKIAEHIDHTNPHTFEVEDLRMLILKATADIEEGDRKRREKFKEYEMEKKFEQEEKKKQMDEEHRKKYEEELQTLEKKHKEHKPLHHPGSKKQLEEVWEQQDHMDSANFDPRAFFFIHDLDGNRFWDQTEVKALFLKELDKMYQAGAPEDDLRERAEEMERMREHVFSESDVDKDGLISLKEFLNQTKKPEFNKDDGWHTVDETPIYTPEDYRVFLEKRHHEIQDMVAKGILPPDYNSGGPGNHQQLPPQHQQQQQQFHGQVPPQQQFHGQVPPQQQFHGQVPPEQQFHGQVPPQQQFQGQLPPQHIQQQQQQQQQYQAQQIPQYQGQHQVPQYQGQQHVPQYQGQQQIPQYQGQVQQQQQQYGQVPPQQQHIQQGNVPVQQAAVPAQQAAVPAQQAAVPAQQQAAVPAQQKPEVQQQAAVPVQQNTQNQANVQGQVPVQQQNVPAPNTNQAQQQAHQVPAGNVPQAPAPNVVAV